MQKISIQGIEVLTRAFREMMRVKRADRRRQAWITLALARIWAKPSRSGLGEQKLSGGTGVFEPSPFQKNPTEPT
jgi:hypothetical protein